MVRNAPHAAMVRRRTKVIVDGEVHFEDNFVTRIVGLFTLLESDAGVELAARARRAASTGSVSDPAAAFRVAGTPPVEVREEDDLIMVAPGSVRGRWRVTSVRWTPIGTRLVLSRVAPAS